MNINSFLRYFDLNSKLRPKRAAAKAAGAEEPSRLHWAPQFAALFLGIFIEPYLAHYRGHENWDFDGGWGRVLFAAIVAFAIFPQVYKSVVTEPRPVLVLLGPIFTAGLGWQTLLGTAIKAAID